MSHLHALSNLPIVSNLLPRAATSAAVTAKDTSTTSPTTSASSGSTTDIGSTFLSLLVQELQNQDPTAPMDSTAMVGQMISLNQLSQLTSIDQVVSNAFGTTSGATTPSSPSGSIKTNALPATQAALRMLSGPAVNLHPAVSSSVTLPAS